ncbi:MAG: TetR/AcrR family transcriptional regulator [Solirubrobacterales bacterium]
MSGAKEAIIEAAKKVIAQQGVNNASIQAIVDEAGISKGALYYHFKSKEMLLLDVIDQTIQEYAAPAQASRSVDKERFRQALLQGIGKRLQNETYNKLQFYLAHEAVRGNEELENRFAAQYDRWIESSQHFIDDLYGLPETRLSRALAAALVAMNDGQAVQLLVKAQPVPMQEMMELWDFMLMEGIPLLLARLIERERTL